MTGRALEMTLCEIPSSSLVCDLKCETTKMTSFTDTDLNWKPCEGAVKIWYKDYVWDPRGEIQRCLHSDHATHLVKNGVVHH